MTQHSTILVGMAQLLVEGGELERNLRRATDAIRGAAEIGCDLVLLPECLDLGWTHPSAKDESKPIPGPSSDRLCRQAARSAIHVCAGLTERAGARTYNSAILVDPGGEILLKYRKINVLAVGREYYGIGDSLSVVETRLGVIGVNICSDNYLDSLEIGKTLGKMGAQIILSPSSWTVDYSQTDCDNPYAEKWLEPYSILAREYDLVVVSATSVGVIVGGPYEGKKMVGCSLAVDKTGVIGRGGYNELAGQLIVTRIDIPGVPRRSPAAGEKPPG